MPLLFSYGTLQQEPAGSHSAGLGEASLGLCRVAGLIVVRVSALLVGVIVASGCDVERSPIATVVDSAGVRIAMSPEMELPYGAVSSNPVLSLGGADAEGPAQFGQIAGVARDAAGSIWVADAQASELRLFDSSGRHIVTVGRQGEGPGEFRRIRLLGLDQGDRPIVWDDRLARLTAFDSVGSLLVEQSALNADEVPPRALAVFGNGDVFGQIPTVFRSPPAPGSILASTHRFRRFDLNGGTSRVIAEAPSPMWLWTGSNQLPIPFTSKPGYAVLGASAYIVSGSEFNVQRFDDSGLRERFGVTREPRVVDQATLASYREGLADIYPDPALRAEAEEALGHSARPDQLPAYDRVLTGATGHVWAQQYTADRLGPFVWDVFGAGRQYLGHVSVPKGLLLMGVSTGQVVGVWLDDLMVEHVRVYTLDTF